MSFSREIIYNILNLIGKGKHFLSYSQTIELFPFGMITRLIPFIIILFLYKYKNELENKILIFYSFSIILYCLFPFDLLMGRLTNNGRILESLLFPILIKQYKNKINKMLILFFIIFYFLLVLTNQLLKQRGYYPYINTLFY